MLDYYTFWFFVCVIIVSLLTIILLIKKQRKDEKVGKVLRKFLDNTKAKRVTIYSVSLKNMSKYKVTIKAEYCDYLPPLESHSKNLKNITFNGGLTKVIKKIMEESDIVVTIETINVEMSNFKLLLNNDEITFFNVFSVLKTKRRLIYGVIEYVTEPRRTTKEVVLDLLLVNELRNTFRKWNRIL